MPHQRWAERLEDELARRGVPARFRSRLLSELRDHADDLADKEGLKMSTESMLSLRLGEPEQLASQAAEEYRRSRWVSRHPLIVFGLLPLPILLFACAVMVTVYGLAAYGIASIFVGDVNDLPRPVVKTWAYALAWSIRFLPFVVVSAFLTRLYLRSRVNRWWFVVTACQILLVAGSMVSSIQLSDVPGQSQFSLGLAWMPISTSEGWQLPLLPILGWMQFFQLLAPLGVGLLMFRAARRKQAALAVGY